MFISFLWMNWVKRLSENQKPAETVTKLIITEYKDKIASVLMENSRPVQISMEPLNQTKHLHWTGAEYCKKY